jgi:hypothetical protein
MAYHDKLVLLVLVLVGVLVKRQHLELYQQVEKERMVVELIDT